MFQGCLKLLEGEREEICFRAVLITRGRERERRFVSGLSYITRGRERGDLFRAVLNY